MSSSSSSSSSTDGGRGGIKFGETRSLDDDVMLSSGLGGGDNNDDNMVTELPTLEEERRMMMDDDDDYDENNDEGRIAGYNGGGDPNDIDDNNDPFHNMDGGSGLVNTRIRDRESSYHARRHDREINGDTEFNFKNAMIDVNLERERRELLDEARKELVDEETGTFKTRLDPVAPSAVHGDGIPRGDGTRIDGEDDNNDGDKSGGGGGSRRRRRWDIDEKNNENHRELLSSGGNIVTDGEHSTMSNKSRWDDDISTSSTVEGGGATAAARRRKRWDETPVVASGSAAAGGKGAALPPDATPLIVNGSQNSWDATPIIATGRTSSAIASTPLVGGGGGNVIGTDGRPKRSRWDSTPIPMNAATPLLPGGTTPLLGGQTPMLTNGNLVKALTNEREMERRNRPWTDAALDAILPTEGYVTLPPPVSYLPMRTPGRQLLATPTPFGGRTGMNGQADGFVMDIPPEEREGQTVQEIREAYGVPVSIDSRELMGGESAAASDGALPYIKPEDMQYFGRLMEDTDEKGLTKEESKERQIMALLLKIKSGTPPQRKTAMRQITDKARTFGAGPLFQQILPLLMSPALEDQERHLLVKVIDRVLYKLDDLVRPFVHRILAVIEPLLIDEDYYARVEGREIISNLAKAAGLSTMISTMRPDIDSPDEYVRNTTSRAFAVVASALGVPSLLPFLKAVCRSRKSWTARHTGIKIVQQIALLMGCAVLPYLRELVEIMGQGLTDEQPKVRMMAALTVSSLAEAAHPYGIESFDSVIRALWKGALEHHGKGLAAFLKAIGYVIPLMEENYASHYTRLVMPILIREFHSPDEEMKRIVLKVVQQCISTAGVEPDYIRKEILPEFFRNFWIRRMALDRRNYKQVIETTEELAMKVGCSDILSRIVDDLKDDSEPYRRMVMETIQKVLEKLGSADVDDRLEERLIDGILYAFQEQAVDAGTSGAFGKEGQVMLDGFGTVVNALGERCKPYLKQIAGTIKWRLNNKAASVRMQAADLIGRIAVVMKACGEEQLMGHLGVVLYEYLGEEYPDVLGSILGALRAIVNVIGMTKMTPPIRDLLPRLTPILRNRHEKVQENCIDLVS